mgnify:CR=1 FL=1
MPHIKNRNKSLFPCPILLTRGKKGYIIKILLNIDNSTIYKYNSTLGDIMKIKNLKLDYFKKSGFGNKKYTNPLVKIGGIFRRGSVQVRTLLLPSYLRCSI